MKTNYKLDLHLLIHTAAFTSVAEIAAAFHSGEAPSLAQANCLINWLEYCVTDVCKVVDIEQAVSSSTASVIVEAV